MKANKTNKQPVPPRYSTYKQWTLLLTNEDPILIDKANNKILGRNEED
jgi:hypothetical protein